MKEDIRDVQMNVIMAPLKYDRNALKETINIQHRTYKHYNFLIYTEYLLLNSRRKYTDLYNLFSFIAVPT